jgi:PAS domain-containing protein
MDKLDGFFEKAVFMRYALDAVPSIILVTDEDARILFRNQAGRDLLKGEKVYNTRAGEAMHCVHSEDVPGGCGKGPHCANCVVRNSVNSAFAGKTLRRQPTELEVKTGGKTLKVPALISVSGFTYEGRIYSLLVIEDISELAELRSLLPICSSCKKIRAEDGTWDKVETYIKAHSPEVNLSHGLCPDCAKKMYPKYSD